VTVYLLHFSAPYHHARHYLGSAKVLSRRLADHARGAGANIVKVILDAGLTFTVARCWNGGRRLERRLKRWHKSPQLCPICRAARAAM
jgi:predicted GIY-YIG superfamily endonuclease